MTFNSSKLASGLSVLTYNMPWVQSAAINLIVKVGSRYETIGEAGISHFLEHMAFKGTKTRSAKVIAEEFDAIGGHFNAYTGREQTVYYAKVIASNLPKALDIISDIIQNSVFDQADIEKEYNVILQEIAQTQDNPDELAFEGLYRAAYLDQPIGKSILGTQASISTFDKSAFDKYIAKHYCAENMYLSIAGNVEHEDILKLAEKYFNNLPSKQAGQSDLLPAKYTSGHSAIVKDLEQTTFVLGFESIPYWDLSQFYHMQILSLIFGGGISSRLFQTIREQLGLVYSIGAYASTYQDSGIFSIYSATSVDKILKLSDSLAEEIKKIRQLVNKEELSRAKEQIKTSLYMAEEKSSYKSEEIGKNFAVFGKYTSVEEVMEYVMATTSEDVEKMAYKIFSTKPTISVVGPDAETNCSEIQKNYSNLLD